jgi:hypothetical protein
MTLRKISYKIESIAIREQAVPDTPVIIEENHVVFAVAVYIPNKTIRTINGLAFGPYVIAFI